MTFVQFASFFKTLEYICVEVWAEIIVLLYFIRKLGLLILEFMSASEFTRFLLILELIIKIKVNSVFGPSVMNLIIVYFTTKILIIRTHFFYKLDS